ncbi:MAG: hypothetical protein B5766_00475 [Candidatus Lumbricidophila eiseniae]|uniref:Uncharacterized protein n=1 Tax=Candidatus Lumbricidiphila eiseniae TaxID=1969409 RepID=A0A2A6FV13_9MICO|nr:MAG: hypothetical protein B5766_00475 [Candidatus Lumbricidophila eiseniae]
MTTTNSVKNSGTDFRRVLELVSAQGGLIENLSNEGLDRVRGVGNAVVLEVVVREFCAVGYSRVVLIDSGRPAGSSQTEDAELLGAAVLGLGERAEPEPRTLTSPDAESVTFPGGGDTHSDTERLAVNLPRRRPSQRSRQTPNHHIPDSPCCASGLNMTVLHPEWVRSKAGGGVQAAG